MLRALLIFEKYETTTYDCRMRSYSQNIFQWNKNEIRSTRMTTGYYCFYIHLVPHIGAQSSRDGNPSRAGKSSRSRKVCTGGKY